MSIANEIAPELPYLRRFARALCGTQSSGDAYVAATLQALIEDPSTFRPDISPRGSLYRVFLKIWSSLAMTLDANPSGYSAADRNLSKLTPRSRQAFLLRAMEGFQLREVAAIMEVSTDQTLTLLETASREIAQQVATDVLIIEDEPVIALDLEAIVHELGHQIVGVARTRAEAAELIEERQPGLVLADIQLADGSSGLDAVNDILRSNDVVVIFITAYPERFLTGDRPEPAFLLTKPFEPEAVRAAISQALFFDKKASRKAA
jgi:DNA-directed RNA polymerase specialized sigma24 family protein